MIGLVVAAGNAFAEDAPTQDTTIARPTIQMNRWEEDWSVLADPVQRTEPLDSLKYISLSDDPHAYLSLGLTLRERFELYDAINFALGDSYLLQRLQVHADAHFSRHLYAFVELEDVRAFGKQTITPVDENPLDVRLAYVEYDTPIADTTFKARLGRQDFAFDLQRFLSLRDGPNVRQSYDAAWADWETHRWRFIGLVSAPVQYQHGAVFDDTPSLHTKLGMLRIERHVLGTNELSAYYARYDNKDSKFLDASGDEHRNVFDARFAGRDAGLDWDLEAMGQTGSVGPAVVRAWALGARESYALTNRFAIGVQADAASGDQHPKDGTLGTFNPLFPNGYYFTLAGDTGYTNLYHLKPSVTMKPAKDLVVLAAIGFQWRETTADAVYVQPDIPVAGTAGQPGAWSGCYGQLRADYRFDANVTAAVETVHFEVGDVIRHAGGVNSDYIGIEGTFAW